jgi:hypothetical protein
MPTQAQRGGGGVALTYSQPGTSSSSSSSSSRMVCTMPRLLYPRERLGTNSTGGWVGLRAGLDNT